MFNVQQSGAGEVRAAEARSGQPDEIDHVDRVLAQWARENPHLDVNPVAVIARLGRIRVFLDREHEELFSRHGLTRQSWDVLACLRRAGEPYQLTPSQLNHEVMRTSGAITHTLHGLEYLGLVERVSHPEDARSVPVRLTEAGHELMSRVAPEHLANERQMLSALTDAEQSILAGLLRKLLVRFEESALTTPSDKSPGPRRRSRGPHKPPG
jgi:DNA-binding MarR family transcriptional regulator